MRDATYKTVPIAHATPPNILALSNDPWLRDMISPPMGEPVSAAIAEMEKAAPVQTPMSWIGEI